jgi:hypothetical protein
MGSSNRTRGGVYQYKKMEIKFIGISSWIRDKPLQSMMVCMGTHLGNADKQQNCKSGNSPRRKK